MTLEQIAHVLGALGCPPEKCAEMAAQLDKRAGQMVLEKNHSREEALVYLIGLMKQGWSAKERGL